MWLVEDPKYLGNKETASGEIFPLIYIQKRTPRKINRSLACKIKSRWDTYCLKIDTGADINVISSKMFRKKKSNLKPAHGIYKSPGGTLICKRKFTVDTQHKDKAYIFEIDVIDNNTNNLLCRYELVTVVTNVNENLRKFTGCMKGDPIKITQRDDAVPFCTTTARRIPFPILPKVKRSFNA